MLTMKTHERQAKNDDRAEDLRAKVLDKIEAQIAGDRYTPDELTRLLEALQRPATGR